MKNVNQNIWAQEEEEMHVDTLNQEENTEYFKLEQDSTKTLNRLEDLQKIFFLLTVFPFSLSPPWDFELK